MPEASVHLPITPPRASISRTICPLATPPMAGLQLIWATVSALIESSAVRAPIRAADMAASTPAWPAPTTTTSHSYVSTGVMSFEAPHHNKLCLIVEDLGIRVVRADGVGHSTMRLAPLALPRGFRQGISRDGFRSCRGDFMPGRSGSLV